MSVHVPSPVTVKVVERQEGAVSVGLHRYMRDADSPEPVSFESGLMLTFDAYEAEPESADATGAPGELTVTVIVEPAHDTAGVDGAQVPVIELHTAYLTGVVVPVNVTRGSNVT